MSMFVHKGGGGSKKPKKLSTWFVDDPLENIEFPPGSKNFFLNPVVLWILKTKVRHNLMCISIKMAQLYQLHYVLSTATVCVYDFTSADGCIDSKSCQLFSFECFNIWKHNLKNWKATIFKIIKNKSKILVEHRLKIIKSFV